MTRLLTRVCLGVALAVLLPEMAWAQSETVEYYGSDAIGSIRIVFDASGNVLGRQDYAPFGRELFSAQALPKERFGGNTTDGESDQGYFQARQYQSRTGRFTQIDPIYRGLFEPQGWNRYTYAFNNPVLYADPLGLDPCPQGFEADYCVNVPGDPSFASFWTGFASPYSLPIFGELPLRALERLAQKGLKRIQRTSTTAPTTEQVPPTTPNPPPGPPTPPGPPNPPKPANPQWPSCADLRVAGDMGEIHVQSAEPGNVQWGGLCIRISLILGST